jgi:hypothetical protein
VAATGFCGDNRQRGERGFYQKDNSNQKQPLKPMAGGIIAIVYLACIAGVIIHILRLIGQFVRAQQRLAEALELIARNLHNGKT